MAWHSTWNEPPPRRRSILGGTGFTPPGVRAILFVTIGVYIADGFLNRALTEIGALSVRNVWHLYPLVTYQFLHGGFAHIFWNMFLLWMLGVTLERQLGTRQFLYLYLISGVVGGLCECGFNVAMDLQGHAAAADRLGGRLSFLDIPAVGASAGVAGVLVAFACKNPRAVFYLFFLLPVEARWVALVYVLAETRHIVLGLQHGWADGVAHAAHFGGMAVGYLWMKYGGRVWLWWSARSAGRPQWRPRGQPTEGEEAEVERILKKIHEQGIDSLTPHEKAFLQDVSRRRRGPF